MKYKLVIFDWDGCLAQTLEIWLAEYKRASGEEGLYFSDLELVKHFFGTGYLGAKRAGVKDPEMFYAGIKPIVSNKLCKAPLYSGVRELLTELNDKGILLALVSSSHRYSLESALKFHKEIADLFDVVVAGDDVENMKPHPEPVEKALKSLGVESNEALMVGDSPHDMNAGRTAGTDTAVYYPDSHTIFYDEEILKSHSPTYFVRSFEELRHIILSS